VMVPIPFPTDGKADQDVASKLRKALTRKPDETILPTADAQKGKKEQADGAIESGDEGASTGADADRPVPGSS
ncbi:MAG: hypothetical protein AAF989_07525, partial [Planctomycetota bacterium]